MRGVWYKWRTFMHLNVVYDVAVSKCRECRREVISWCVRMQRDEPVESSGFDCVFLEARAERMKIIVYGSSVTWSRWVSLIVLCGWPRIEFLWCVTTYLHCLINPTTRSVCEVIARKLAEGTDCARDSEMWHVSKCPGTIADACDRRYFVLFLDARSVIWVKNVHAFVSC